MFEDYRTYKSINDNGIIEFMKVKYSIVIKNDKIYKIFNEHNHSIMPNSETFLFFKNKYE